MAQQGTEEKTGSTGDEGSGQGTPADEGTGRHAASEQTAGTEQPSGQGGSGQDAEPSAQETESSGQKTEQSSGTAAAEQPTQKHETQKHETPQRSPEPPTEKHEAQPAGSAPQRGRADTSWAEPERETSGSSRRSVDVGELVWRTGNVIATVVRTLALLFTLVLVVNVVLVLVGVNPANGVAQFVGAVADIVILGFRDLFIPANPLLMLIVNSLVAAVFWVFVGELLSRLIRFLAARVK